MPSAFASLYTPSSVAATERVSYWRSRLADPISRLDQVTRVLLYEVVTPPARSALQPRTPDLFIEVQGVGAEDIADASSLSDELSGLDHVVECFDVDSHEIIPPDSQRPDDYVMLYVMYRWHGMSKSEFRDHYLDVHAVLGSKVPGLKWYDVNLTQGSAVLETQQPPVPDAFTFCAYDSEEVFAESLKSPELVNSMADDENFCGAYFDRVVRRHNIKG